MIFNDILATDFFLPIIFTQVQQLTIGYTGVPSLFPWALLISHLRDS